MTPKKNFAFKKLINKRFLLLGDVPDECCLIPSDGCGKGKGNLDEQSAKSEIYTKGCFSAFELLVQDNTAAAAGVGAGVAVLLFLGVLISCCVAKNMKAESNYV